MMVTMVFFSSPPAMEWGAFLFLLSLWMTNRKFKNARITATPTKETNQYGIQSLVPSLNQSYIQYKRKVSSTYLKNEAPSTCLKN